VLDGYRQLLWSQATSGASTSAWTYTNIPVSSSSNFSLVFEAQSGQHVGVVALDEVSLSSGCFIGGEANPECVMGTQLLVFNELLKSEVIL